MRYVAVSGQDDRLRILAPIHIRRLRIDQDTLADASQHLAPRQRQLLQPMQDRLVRDHVAAHLVKALNYVQRAHDMPSRSHPGSLGASVRSEEHTSELQSLMRISYAVFCLKKKIN